MAPHRFGSSLRTVAERRRPDLAATDMARTHGHAPAGERLEGEAPYVRWRTATFLGGPRDTGFVAPLVVDRAMTCELSLSYVQRVLVPEPKEGDVVVMDNLSCDETAGVREAIEGAKAKLLDLPAYSPDLDPIELAFSKLKRPRAGRRSGPPRVCGGPSAGCWTASAPRSAANTYASAATPLRHPEERSRK